MKRIQLTLFVIIGIFTSCGEDVKTFALGIDVQSFFDQDNVQVFIDDKKVINEQLETNLTTGVCMTIRLHKNEGNHAIRVIVNGTTTETEVFSLKDDLYIGINYDQLSKEISFLYNDQSFGYK